MSFESVPPEQLPSPIAPESPDNRSSHHLEMNEAQALITQQLEQLQATEDSIRWSNQEVGLAADTCTYLLYELAKKVGITDPPEQQRFVHERYQAMLDGTLRRIEQLNIPAGGLACITKVESVAPISAPIFQRFIQRIKKVRVDSTTSLPAEGGEITVGTYNKRSGKISLHPAYLEMAKNPESIVTQIAQSGFTNPLSTLHHEYIHKGQFDSPAVETLKGGLRIAGAYTTVAGISAAAETVGIPVPMAVVTLGALKLNQIISRPGQGKDILEEVQAFVGQNRFNNEIQNLDEIIKKLEAYNVSSTEQESVRQITAADNVIRQLYALGESDAAIGALVRKSRWNKKSGEFTALQRRLVDLMAERELSQDDVEALVVAENIQQEIFLNHVRLIAQEELANAITTLKQSNGTVAISADETAA